ncbi:MAG TPA: hypothetical protein EYQ08_01165 [Planctomycetes bacterium]|nr:hypothetical protein [Planctomycetota bacterium]
MADRPGQIWCRRASLAALLLLWLGTGLPLQAQEDPAIPNSCSNGVDDDGDSIAHGPLAPDYFQVQSHSTGFNCNSIPTFVLLGSVFGPGVHVIAEAQYQILTSGATTINFCSMTGQMPVPVALAAVDFGAMTDCSDVFAPAAAGTNISSTPEFVRGDTNASGRPLDLADAINSLYYIFNIPGGISPCDDASDVNDDGLHPNIADAIYLLNYLFPPPSPPPPAPFPACGPDPTIDTLGCAFFPPCP